MAKKRKLSKRVKKKRTGRPPTGITPIRMFRCADDDWEMIVDAAEFSGAANTSVWMRDKLLRAAKRALRS